MRWNWQQPDWPEFNWDSARLRLAEERFLIENGQFAGVSSHLSTGTRIELAVAAMSAEAVTTSEIEGEALDRASVQSSIRGHLGLATDRRPIKAAERGIAELTTTVHDTFAEPLTHEVLFAWHRTLMQERLQLRYLGKYRTGNEPMQVVSGALYAHRVHYEAPPAANVPKEMTRFLKWFNRSPLPPLTRAGVGHLYFESIHPFEDGNGRIGRAIAEKALAQAVSRPTLIALSATILRRRKSYYAALEAASKKLEITDWLCWFASTAIEAQRRAAAQVDLIIEKTRLLDSLRDELNPRQEKALLRMFHEGPDGFEGGLTAGKYASITRASPATTTRDLAGLVELGALTKRGELRHARYELNVKLNPTRPVRIEKDGTVTPRAGVLSS